MTFFRSQFDKLLDKATSPYKLESDWPIILQICDLIRQGDVQPKYALGALKKKMTNTNPHVAMFSLDVLESCVKNCGAMIHDEIGTKAYMEQLKETIKTMQHANVKAKLLELIQAWAYAFRNNPKYRAVQDTVNIMKAEGYNFPVLKESDAMFSADSAPGWEDGDRCLRCKVQFSLISRKHHCRACGQVFCGQCSSKSCSLPKFGIEKEVRVCDVCYENANKPSATTFKADDLPVEYLTSSLAQQSQAPPPRKSDAELKEEEELQLAIALSQSEAEQKSKIGSTRSTPVNVSSSTRTKSYSPPPKLSTSPEADPDLARYLNRSYWQQQSAEYSNASAPVLAATPTPPKQTSVPEQNGVEESEMEEFVTALQSQVEIFVNRMKSNSSRGRSIANDSSVQTLFMNITAMHSKLLRYIQQQDDKRVYYEGLQDKLAQVKDARAALDALREEHREKLRREAELAERQRQLQMAQKLDIMRQKKQEYLQYQRQLALQRIQEQEREMQIRQEQQKQQYLMGAQYGTLPYMRQGPGYDLAGRYPNPPPQSAPPFTHFPAPGSTAVHLDGTMTPGGPMLINQPRPPPDQGLIMRQPSMMPPTGMVPPQNMMPLGPQGGNIPPHMQMMSQRTPGPGQPPVSSIGPQSFNGPPIPGSQSLQNPLPNMPIPQPLPGGVAIGSSQTLPRPSGSQSSMVQQPGLQGPPQSLPGQPPLGGSSQSFPEQPPMNGPQAQSQPMGIPQSLPGVQPQPSLNGPQAPPLSGPPQPSSGMVGPGMPLGNQPMLSSLPHPQNQLPPHMVAQNMPPMMAPSVNQQQMGGPGMPQQQFQQPPQPPQPQNEDKTAELISFD